MSDFRDFEEYLAFKLCLYFTLYFCNINMYHKIVPSTCILNLCVCFAGLATTDCHRPGNVVRVIFLLQSSRETLRRIDPTETPTFIAILYRLVSMYKRLQWL